MRLGREYQRLYTIDGEPGWTLQQVMDALPGARYDAIGKRLRRGVRTWADLKAPARESRRPQRMKREPNPNPDRPAIEPPCPLNAEFRRWTKGAGKGRALQALDVHTDPLRPSVAVRA